MQLNELLDVCTEPARRKPGRNHPPRPEWLALQIAEAAIDPGIPIVDSHFHLIDVPNYRYLARDQLADVDASAYCISGMIYAEAQTGYRPDGPGHRKPLGEVEYVRGALSMDDRLHSGIVGYADLMLGADVRKLLAAQIDAGRDQFKGVRYTTALDPDPRIRVHHRTAPGWLNERPIHETASTVDADR